MGTPLAALTGHSVNVTIAIDAWKLPIFERHLKHAGYSYTEMPLEGLTSIALAVTTNTAQALGVVVRAANDEATHTGAPQ